VAFVLNGLETKNSARNFSAMNPVTTENHGKSRGKLYYAIELTPCVVNENTNKDSASSQMYCVYCNWCLIVEQ